MDIFILFYLIVLCCLGRPVYSCFKKVTGKLVADIALLACFIASASDIDGESCNTFTTFLLSSSSNVSMALSNATVFLTLISPSTVHFLCISRATFGLILYLSAVSSISLISSSFHKTSLTILSGIPNFSLLQSCLIRNQSVGLLLCQQYLPKKLVPFLRFLVRILTDQ